MAVDAPRKPRVRRTRYLWPIGLALYLAVLWYVGWGRIGEALSSIQWPLLLAMMATEASAQWTRVLKWRLALGPGHNAAGLFFLSKAAGYWSPGRLGEFSPLLLTRHRSPRLGAWIFVDRLIEMTATLVLGLAGLLALRFYRWEVVLALAAAVLGAVAAAAYVGTRHGWMERQALRFAEGTRMRRAVTFAANAGREARRFSRSLPLAAPLTLAATALDIVSGMLLLLSFGYSVSFFVLATVQLTHAVTSAVPVTPNATGVPYLAAMTVLHELGGVPAEVLATAVALQIAAVNLVFWSFFGLGMLFLRRGER